MKGKKGLSTVVTTLILVLLVLAAIGIVWNPIKSLLTKSGDSLDRTKCLDVDIRATKIVNVTDTTYNVTLVRSSTGDGTFSAKLILFDKSGNSAGVQSANTDFDPLDVKVVGPITGPANATKIEVTPTYVDSNGKEQICNTKTTREFNL